MQKTGWRPLKKCYLLWVNHDQADRNMKQLKAEGKEKSATYRQLAGSKMQYRNMLSMYSLYGLIEDDDI